jgi:hypothetical protein
VKSGYTINYAGVGTAVNAATCVAATTTTSPQYFGAATPVAVGTTGTRHFATSESQTIFQDTVAITARDQQRRHPGAEYGGGDQVSDGR